MHLRLVCLLLFGLQVLLCRAQQSHQFTLVNENDNYLLTYSDRYYTNGIMLRYTAGGAPGKTVTRLTTVEAGQMIFTPYSVSPEYRKDMDRPFTGLLYAKVLRTRIQNNGRLLQWGVQAGVIGEKAFGREVQRWHHRTWNLEYPFGWQKQLKTGVGFNLEGKVVQPLLHVGSPRFGLRLNSSGHAAIGTLFAQATTAIHLSLGASGNTTATAAFDTRVSRLQTAAPTEWFFFYEPQLTRQWYNATLQGTWRQQADNYFTTTPQPVVFQQRAGFVFAPRRWTTTLAVTHKTKEATTMRTSENWGTVAVAYRW